MKELRRIEAVPSAGAVACATLAEEGELRHVGAEVDGLVVLERGVAVDVGAVVVDEPSTVMA